MIIIIIMTMKENKNPSNQIKGKEIKSYLKKLSEQSSTDPTNSTNIWCSIWKILGHIGGN